MLVKNGNFHLDRGVYDAMISSIKIRHITYKDWANVMRDKIKVFNSFCAYDNKYNNLHAHFNANSVIAQVLAKSYITRSMGVYFITY